MNALKLFTVGFFITLLTSFSSDKLPKDFSDLLDRAHLTFIRPDGMNETKCIENRQMNCEYALKYPDKKFEVRYAIRPMDSELENYDITKKRGDLIIHPNKVSKTVFEATLLNIGLGGSASGQLPNITYFDSSAVKKEFNADWGATAFVNLGPEFGGQVYKYCIAVIIHKDFIGDGYFFYVSDSKEKIGDLMDNAFHSLKFKQ